MVAVGESLFEGAFLGLDPVAGWLYVRLLQLAARMGGVVPLPPGMRPEVALTRATGLTGAQVRQGLKGLLVPRGGSPMVRIDPDAVVVLGPEEGDELDDEPQPPPSERRARSHAERQRAYRERRRGVTGCDGVTERDVTGDEKRDVTGDEKRDVTGDEKRDVTGSRAVENSLSLSLARQKEEKREKKHEILDACSRDGDASVTRDVTGDGVTSVTPVTGVTSVTQPVTQDFALIGSLAPASLTPREVTIQAVLTQRAETLWPAAPPQALASAARRASQQVEGQAMAGRHVAESELPLCVLRAVDWVAQRAAGFTTQTQEQRLLEVVRAVGREVEWAAAGRAKAGSASAGSDFVAEELEKKRRIEARAAPSAGRAAIG